MSVIAKQLSDEIRKTPLEYLPFLLNIVHSFRESVSLKSAEESFRQGWQETTKGETKPIKHLWDDV